MYLGTKWVRIGLGRVVMKKLKESHTSAELKKISSDFIPVNLAWSRAKGKAPSKQLSLVLS